MNTEPEPGAPIHIANLTERSRPKGKPAPRRGPSPTKGVSYQKSERTALRKMLGNAVRRRPGYNGHQYATAVAQAMGLEVKPVRAELESMAREGLLRKVLEFRGGGKGHDNFYAPEYKLKGRTVTLLEAVRSEHNVHQLAYNTVRERVLRGLSVEEALSVRPTTTGQITALVRRPKEVHEDGESW